MTRTAKRILITGGSGRLALDWAITCRDRASITLALYDRPVSLAGVTTRTVDLESIDEIAKTLDAVEPDVVVHTAGVTSVEACEADERLASHVNVELAGNVAVACARRGVVLVHISTDHLFRGDRPCVTEVDPVEPQNAYARTKAAAERRILDACPDALGVRTNFYGWGPIHRRSFSDTIIENLRRKTAVTLFTDVFYTPVLAEALTHAVHDLIAVKARGIVHVAGDERISKHEFGLRVANHFDLDASLIRPGLLADQRALVRRPFDMSLSNELARRLLGRGLGSVDEHLIRLREQEQDGIAREVQQS